MAEVYNKIQLYAENTSIKYPLSDFSTEDIPYDVLVDMALSVPQGLGDPCLTNLQITDKFIFLSIEAGTTPIGHLFVQDYRPFRIYPLTMFHGGGGWVVFGPGAKNPIDKKRIETQIDPRVVIPGVDTENKFELEVNGFRYEMPKVLFVETNYYVSTHDEIREAKDAFNVTSSRRCLVLRRNDLQLTEDILKNSLVEFADREDPLVTFNGVSPDSGGTLYLDFETEDPAESVTMAPISVDNRVVGLLLDTAGMDGCPASYRDLDAYIKESQTGHGVIYELPLDCIFSTDPPDWMNCSSFSSESSSSSPSAQSSSISSVSTSVSMSSVSQSSLSMSASVNPSFSLSSISNSVSTSSVSGSSPSASISTSSISSSSGSASASASSVSASLSSSSGSGSASDSNGSFSLSSVSGSASTSSGSASGSSSSPSDSSGSGSGSVSSPSSSSGSGSGSSSSGSISSWASSASLSSGSNSSASASVSASSASYSFSSSSYSVSSSSSSSSGSSSSEQTLPGWYCLKATHYQLPSSSSSSGLMCPFEDDFESGTLSKWTKAGTPVVVNNPDGAGKVLELDGDGDRVTADVGYAMTDPEWMFKVRTDGSGDATWWSTNISLSAYMRISGGDLQYLDHLGWNTIMALASNTWYNIRLYDFNFTAKTYKVDINSLYVATCGFRSLAATAFRFISFYQKDPGTSWWDDVEVCPYVIPSSSSSSWSSSSCSSSSSLSSSSSSSSSSGSTSASASSSSGSSSFSSSSSQSSSFSSSSSSSGTPVYGDNSMDEYLGEES